MLPDLFQQRHYYTNIKIPGGIESQIKKLSGEGTITSLGNEISLDMGGTGRDPSSVQILAGNGNFTQQLRLRESQTVRKPVTWRRETKGIFKKRTISVPDEYADITAKIIDVPTVVNSTQRRYVRVTDNGADYYGKGTTTVDFINATPEGKGTIAASYTLPNAETVIFVGKASGQSGTDFILQVERPVNSMQQMLFNQLPSSSLSREL